MIPHRIALAALAGALLLAGCDPLADGPVLADHAAPSLATDVVPGEPVPNQYIVVFRNGIADVPGLARQLARQHGGEAFRTYEHALRGFAFRGSARAAEALARHPHVAYVEPDRRVTALSTTQPNPTWGLDRIDQRALPLDAAYTYTTTASNVHVYILDTGIRYTHREFGGRAVFGFDAFGGNGSDGNGHGTHVAGTAGGVLYGVAKGVTLYAVRVLDNNGSGTISGVIAGVDWVTANHRKPAVANMSLGGGASTALDDAVRASIAAGVTYVVAAGNGDRLGRQQDACNFSPARVREALTVGATTNTDTKTSWSNFGPCVDLFAPGASITSAWHTGDTATNTISGTSMAAPHVAGVAALYLAEHPTASPAEVFRAVVENATQNIVANSSTENNHLVYSLFDGTGGGGGGTGPEPEPPPSGGFELSGTGTKVQGRWRADLTWAGSAAAQIDVYRQGSRIATVSNTGTYTDQTSFRGSGSLTYRVCEAGTSTCSNEVTIVF